MYVASPNQKNNNTRNRKKDPTTSIKNLYIKNTGVVRIVDRFYYSKVINSFEINTVKTHKIKAELLK